jgi:diguanylate cyclase (GGDEF)-like protein/hemerythrin-like metal-binding protein
MTSGFRFYFNKPILPYRILLYFLVFLTLIIVFTYLIPHFSIRIIINSFFSSLIIIDAFRTIRESTKLAGKSFYITAQSLFVLYMIVNFLRIFHATLNFNQIGNLTDSNFFSHFSNLFSFISLSFWAIMILAADYSTLLKHLRHTNEELSSMALKDSLTGLFNRHYLDNQLPNFIAYAEEYKQPLSFILFDLDNFKLINDIYGHDHGDVVLKMTAQSALKSIRKTDIAYRWGGEEFLVILPNTSMEVATEVAEIIRKTVKDDFGGPSGQVSVSLGVSEYSIGDSPNFWFRRIDYALGKAKRTGKDKVVAWSAQTPLPLAFAKIIWQSSWESGEPTIDRQHQELIELSNVVAMIGITNDNDLSIIKKFVTIIDHAKKHFVYEESVLERIGYPDIEAHRHEHAALIEKFTYLIERAKNKEITIKDCFDQFAGTLIIGHLLHYDRLFFPLINHPE